MRKAHGYLFLLCLTLVFRTSFAQEKSPETTFKFGGYIKADFLNTWYRNGDVPETSPLRDYHLPAHIPVGAMDQNFDLDYHVKESRFNFDVKTLILGKEIHGFIEMDFLMSASGDEKVSNSFNPRLRHAYFEWDRLLVGQTWSSFMVVVVPDEIDFAGAMEGLVFIRQPQVRLKLGSWWIAVENPETTIVPYEGSSPQVTDSDFLPDVVVRKNFGGDWGNWSVAAMGRTLNSTDSVSVSAFGFGVTTGGKIRVGSRGGDLRVMATYGNGLGRYINAGFLPSSVMDASGDLNPIRTLNGYVAYNHYWIAEKLSSSFSFSAYQSFHEESLVSPEVNQLAYSFSGNLKYDPVPQLRFGIEYIYGVRELLGSSNGTMHRVQLAAKYFFGYRNTVANEKR